MYQRKGLFFLNTYVYLGDFPNAYKNPLPTCTIADFAATGTLTDGFTHVCIASTCGAPEDPCQDIPVNAFKGFLFIYTY